VLTGLKVKLWKELHFVEKAVVYVVRVTASMTYTTAITYRYIPVCSM